MKFIRSLWTAPPGWRHSGMETLWRLSCLRIIEHHGALTIHTDSTGASWLSGLHLPSSVTVTLALDALPHSLAHVWAIGKVACYAAEQEPFIHLDGDVILGRPLPRRVLSAEVCAEHVYHVVPGKWFERADAPPHWHGDWKRGNGTSFNCGIFGGNNLPAIHRIAQAGFSFAQRNCELLRAVKPTIQPSMVAEEWAIAREFDPLEVECLTANNEAGDYLLKHPRAYWHQAGKSKLDPANMEKTKERLRAALTSGPQSPIPSCY